MAQLCAIFVGSRSMKGDTPTLRRCCVIISKSSRRYLPCVLWREEDPFALGEVFSRCLPGIIYSFVFLHLCLEYSTNAVWFPSLPNPCPKHTLRSALEKTFLFRTVSTYSDKRQQHRAISNVTPGRETFSILTPLMATLLTRPWFHLQKHLLCECNSDDSSIPFLYFPSRCWFFTKHVPVTIAWNEDETLQNSYLQHSFPSSMQTSNYATSARRSLVCWLIIVAEKLPRHVWHIKRESKKIGHLFTDQGYKS